MKDKADVAFQFYDNLVGTPATQTNSIALEELGLPRLQLDELGNRFTKEEVWKVIRSLPLDKAPGPDSFTVRFLQSTWKIIRLDLMRVLDAFWHRDMRSFHSLNQALMVLLLKYSETLGIEDLWSIALIQLIGKLVSKILANWLAARLPS
jgi:hypothetical protein